MNLKNVAMEKYNIMIGRFQPLTYAHTACCTRALMKNGLRTILCMIDRPEEKMDKRNPFPTKEFAELYKDVLRKDFKDKVIADIILVKNADVVKLSQEVDFEIGAWICGEDRYDAYKAMVDKYRDQMNVSEDFELIKIDRTDDDISATKARQALEDNDSKTWSLLTPFDFQFKKFKECYDKYR